MNRRGWFFLLIFLAGCGQGQPVLSVEDSPYYPLRVGTRWVFQGAGEKRSLEVVKHVLLEGTPTAVVETRIDGKKVAVEHLQAKKDGLFILAIGNKPLTKPLPFLRLPAKPGRTWKVHFNDRTETQVFQIGKDQVTVPFGTFETITLRSDLFVEEVRKLSNVYWFAKDVGIVKQVIEAEQKIATYELVEFVVGK